MRENVPVTDWSVGALSALQDILEATDSLPYVQIVAGIGLKILEVIQTIQTNKNDYQRLGIHVQEIVMSLADTEDDNADEKSNRNNQLQTDLQQFITVMQNILSFTQMQSSRKVSARIWNKNKDADKIQELQANLTHAFSVFQLRTSVSMRMSQSAMSLQIEQMHATLIEPGHRFSSVYLRNDDGIGGYDLRSDADVAFAFDYNHSGKLDHVVLYRPGTGTLWILKQGPDDSFIPVYSEGCPGRGIGGYDILSPSDLAFAFDFDHSGKLDHIVLYRPGTGTLWILKHAADDSFTPVYHEGCPGRGIGGYDILSPSDLAFAFDFDHSGKLDHIVLYRPGTGTLWILKHAADHSFIPVYHEGCPGRGIGGYDILSPSDLAFAFDFDHSGLLDHIAFYRPGTGTIWILKNSQGFFSPVHAQGCPGNGIGGYDLLSASDLMFAYDYEKTGKADHLVIYRPSTGTVWILKHSGSTFKAVYSEGDPGNGIGGYDLKSPLDRAFALDYDHSGKVDHLVLYRAGEGRIWILRHDLFK